MFCGSSMLPLVTSQKAVKEQERTQDTGAGSSETSGVTQCFLYWPVPLLLFPSESCAPLLCLSLSGDVPCSEAPQQGRDHQSTFWQHQGGEYFKG